MPNSIDVVHDCRWRPRLGGRGGAGAHARSPSRVVVIAAALGVAVLASACADRGPSATHAAGAPVESQQVAGAATAPLDPTAPATYAPVVRNGKRPAPSVKGNQGRFSTAAPVHYSDGVSLEVTRVAPGVETGEGPGVFEGRPNTAISLSLVNHSQHGIDLSQVVVTAMYGSPARLAAPVYETAVAKDFNATVKAGGSASATYVFAIPTAQAGNLVMIVDFDGTHAAARFTGPAR